MRIDNIKYQTKPNYIHRKVAGNDILIPIAENVADFNGFIELNPAAAFIWNCLRVPSNINEVIASLVDEFGIDEATARTDAKEFLSLLIEHKMIIEVC